MSQNTKPNGVLEALKISYTQYRPAKPIILSRVIIGYTYP
jgi:hypothetical protein